MYCPKCGEYINDNEYSCNSCGKELVHKKSIKKEKTLFECFKSYFIHYFDATGVASPKETFSVLITNVVIIILLNILGLTKISTLFLLLTFFPTLSLIIRRLHDTNKSGGFASIFGISIILFMGRAFFSNRIAVLTLFFLSILGLLLTILLISKATDNKSRWNDENGYLD